MGHEVLDRRPVRREEQHIVAGIDHGLKRAEQCLHAAVHDDDVLRLRGDAVSNAQFVSDSFAQFENAGRRSVARFVFRECAHHRFFDWLRCLHEWFTTLELVNRCALFAQFHDAIAELDDVRKADVRESRSQSQNRWRGCHCFGIIPSRVVVGTEDYSLRGRRGQAQAILLRKRFN